jgi:hypothetical protein
MVKIQNKYFFISYAIKQLPFQNLKTIAKKDERNLASPLEPFTITLV